MLSKRELAIRNNTVVKANDLIQKSRFSLSLQQQKIVLYLISQIQPQDDDFKLYEFSIPEFCHVVGIDNLSGRDYKEIKAAIKDISDKSLWVEISEDEETLVRFIEKPYINKRSGIIKIRLDKDMKPFLLHLKQNFTKYELIWTLHFRSKYSIRLYELIKSVHYYELEIYEREFPLKQIQKSMDAEKYKQFKDFHTRALRPAVKEINQYSDKNLTYKLIKEGKSVVSILFTISTKNPLDRIKVRDKVEKEMGIDTDQLTLWDELNKGKVDT